MATHLIFQPFFYYCYVGIESLASLIQILLNKLFYKCFVYSTFCNLLTMLLVGMQSNYEETSYELSAASRHYIASELFGWNN